MMSRKRPIQEISRKEEYSRPQELIDEIEMDFATEFDLAVFEACQKIPRGKVSTYKHIANAIGSPRAYRAVSASVKKNPLSRRVPCYRVVPSNLVLEGPWGGTDPMDKELQRRKKMLEEEGVRFDEDSSKRVRVAESSVFTFSP